MSLSIMFGIIISLQDEAPSNEFGAIYWNSSRSDVSIHLRIHCAAAISSSIINEDVKCARTCGSYTCPSHNTPTTMFNR